MRHGTVGGYFFYKCRCDLCREAQRAYSREKYLANRESKIEEVRRRHDENRGARLAYYLEWQRANPEKRALYRARRRAARVRTEVVPFTVDQLKQRWAYYGNNCWMCGNAANASDHVKPLSKGGAHMLCNLRPACTRCNSTKGDRWPYYPDRNIDNTYRSR